MDFTNFVLKLVYYTRIYSMVYTYYIYSLLLLK